MMVEEADTSLYKWIVMATGEDWLTEDDLYDFNFAFAFAAGSTPDKFSYEIFDNSLEYQSTPWSPMKMKMIMMRW